MEDTDFSRDRNIIESCVNRFSSRLPSNFYKEAREESRNIAYLLRFLRKHATLIAHRLHERMFSAIHTRRRLVFHRSLRGAIKSEGKGTWPCTKYIRNITPPREKGVKSSLRNLRPVYGSTNSQPRVQRI